MDCSPSTHPTSKIRQDKNKKFLDFLEDFELNSNKNEYNMNT